MLQLVAAVLKGDVEGVSKCLAHKDLKLGERVHGQTAAEALSSPACKASKDQKRQILRLLLGAGERSLVCLLVCSSSASLMFVCWFACSSLPRFVLVMSTA